VLRAAAASLCSRAGVLCGTRVDLPPAFVAPLSLRLVEPRPDLPRAPRPESSRRRTRRPEAHFSIEVLHIQGHLWPARAGTLDVYQPHASDDVQDAQWELHFAPQGTNNPTLKRDAEYTVEVETPGGRHFDGCAFLQHNAGAIWSFLDTGHPLGGLRPGDLTSPDSA
jgi:hypothetical protein